MKSKTISVVILSLVLSIPLILVSYAYVGLSTQSTSDLEMLRLSKGKPHPNPNTNPELITFVGDLEGNQSVVGCCPNAGPAPNYTMTLSEDVFPDDMTGEPHDGHVFMNVFMNLSLKGHGNKRSYLVKFWWSDYFIKIIGGYSEENKGRKISTFTVIFVDEPCEIWINDIPTDPVTVSFNLTRKQL